MFPSLFPCREHGLNFALSLSGTAQAGPPIQSLGSLGSQQAFGQFGANTGAFNNSNTSSTMFGAANSSFSANTSVNIGTKRNKH